MLYTSMSTSSPNDPIPGLNTSNNIPLPTMAPTSPEDPVAGPSSMSNVPEGAPPMNQKEDTTQAPSSEDSLDKLKREFVEKCAKIEEEHPEVVHKDGWGVMHELLKIRDEKDIKKHFENIDTLLVFAGLYSAILTAFLIEAYKLLQLDSSDDSRQILLEISRQLSSFAMTSGFANATYVPSLPTGSFTPKRSSVWLNGLWFVALILSLTTASLGLLVKQWLREYADSPDVAPEEQCRIRLFRVRGLRKYKISEIATFLPLLLQISLVLFFSGLILFILGVHATIGWVIMGFVVAWGTFLLITIILPWFSASCPYKTPFLKPITLQFKRLLNYLNKRLKSFASIIHFDWLYRALPSGLFDLADSETAISRDSSLDIEVLLDAYKTSGSANVWEPIMQCVDLENPLQSFTNLCSAIVRRDGGHSFEPLPSLAFEAWWSSPSESDDLFAKSLAICIRSRLIKVFEEKTESKLDEDIGRLLLLLNEWSDQLKSRSSSRSSCIGRALVRTSSVLLEGLFSAPFTRESLVKYASELLEGDFNTLRTWEYFDKSSEYRATIFRSLRFSRHCLAMSAFIEASKQVFGPSKKLDDKSVVLGQSRNIFLCAGRSTKECWQALKNEFRHLSDLIARQVDTFRNPSGPQDAYDTFQWHCILDMAMRLHKRIPGIINKTLFEALHTRSVKMFDLYMEGEEDDDGDKKLAKYIRRKPEGGSQTWDASIEPINWDEVLNKYAEVDVRGRREYTEYGDKWDYQRLRVDCKHRMEFILNYELYWGDEIRQMVSDHKL